ncbi:MAG: TauD/TfdA family dioxygenase [Rhodospirillales bacterium]
MAKTSSKYRHIGVKPVASALGAEILGVDLSRDLPDEVFGEIHAAHLEFGVIVCRGQELSPERQKILSARFGKLMSHAIARFRHPDHPEVMVMTNIKNGAVNVGASRAGFEWHSDQSYKPVPALGTLLYGIECPPEGANTEFASMYAAYDALPDARRKIVDQRSGVHDYAWAWQTFYKDRAPLTDLEKAALPPVCHRLARVHPETGRTALYVSEGMTRSIDGMAEETGRALVQELNDFATQPRFIYSHAWQPGDLVFWDNRCLLHRATPSDPQYRRVMQRTMIEDGFAAARLRDQLGVAAQ